MFLGVRGEPIFVQLKKAIRFFEGKCVTLEKAISYAYRNKYHKYCDSLQEEFPRSCGGFCDKDWYCDGVD